MTQNQIYRCITAHKTLNRQYYRDYIWGGRTACLSPSPCDITEILVGYRQLTAHTHTMNANYAYQIATVVLNSESENAREAKNEE